MGYSILLSIFFLFFSFTTFAPTASLNRSHKCSEKESEALLLFKHTLSSINYPIDYFCHDAMGSDNHPRMMSWNTSTDCCKWDGVLCDNSTGDVIVLDLRCGMLQGTIDPDSSLFNLTHLTSLDLSYNSLNGTLPSSLFTFPCLEGLDMGNNRFQGTIPNIYGGCRYLEGIMLNGNQLSGEVPSSIIQCQSLKVLDFGENHLNGTFPGWLGALPNLQVLVLKSNNFHGHLQPSSTVDSPFPSLRVLDFSHNGFVGQLPKKYFQNFNSVKNVVKSSTTPKYLSMGGLYYSFVVAVKGVVRNIPRLFVGLTIIDLSNNCFDREILEIIGNLSALKVLNLAHNSLDGPIPNSLGKLSEIESLDLSWNQLTGNIPQSLAGIKGLKFLNLSQNHLVGRIPEGTQFSTFDENSFAGNLGLCGFPLLKKCSENAHKPQLEAEEHHEEESGFTWEVVIFGYGCGIPTWIGDGFLHVVNKKSEMVQCNC